MEIGMRIAEKMREMGITAISICRKTGIAPGRLYPSLSGKRELRADEFLLICQLLQLDPWEMAGNQAARPGA